MRHAIVIAALAMLAISCAGIRQKGTATDSAAQSGYTGSYKCVGKVVDAETGKPLQGATVINMRDSVQTDSDGIYTIYYHTYDSDLRLFVSRQGYISDTLSCPQKLVRLHPMPKDQK